MKWVTFVFVPLLISLPDHIDAQNLQKKQVNRFLALGDSYTIGESVPQAHRWPDQLIEAFKAKGLAFDRPRIIAVTGWRTDQLKNAAVNANFSRDFDLVSLLIGVNNQYQGKSIVEYEKEFEDLLMLAIEHASGDKSKVFVLSIPDYGFTPFGRDKQVLISKEIDAFNEANKRITLQRGVKYINITDISRRGLTDPDLIAEDGLHPSGKMYALWVERILEHLKWPSLK